MYLQNRDELGWNGKARREIRFYNAFGCLKPAFKLTDTMIPLFTKQAALFSYIIIVFGIVISEWAKRTTIYNISRKCKYLIPLSLEREFQNYEFMLKSFFNYNYQPKAPKISVKHLIFQCCI